MEDIFKEIWRQLFLLMPLVEGNDVLEAKLENLEDELTELQKGLRQLEKK